MANQPTAPKEPKVLPVPTTTELDLSALTSREVYVFRGLAEESLMSLYQHTTEKGFGFLRPEPVNPETYAGLTYEQACTLRLLFQSFLDKLTKITKEKIKAEDEAKIAAQKKIEGQNNVG